MSGHCNDCGGNPCICSEMRSAGIRIGRNDKCPDCGSDPIREGEPCPVCERDGEEAVKRGANKAKRQRDNWKARVLKLEAALRELAETWRKERDFLATGTGSDRSAARLYDECAAALLEKIETMKGER